MLAVAGCVGEPSADRPSTPAQPRETRDSIRAMLPRTVSDRTGWATDIDAAFRARSIPATRDNVCAVLAVISQESSFRINPPIPNLGAVARKEIDTRAAHAGVPQMLVRGALALNSSTGVTYSDRLAAAATEKDLSDLYEDFIGRVPLGRRLFEGYDPIRTRGPMQVNVAFAKSYAAAKPYPYSIQGSLSDELFTRRGSLYFGIAHLLDYEAPYDAYGYRFADYNAGQYASRNAAFQNAVRLLTGTPLVLDGALLPRDAPASGVGNTEAAILGIATGLDLSQRQIHHALEQGKEHRFERTDLYQRVFALADKRQGSALPRAVIPDIELHGAKWS